METEEERQDRIRKEIYSGLSRMLDGFYDDALGTKNTAYNTEPPSDFSKKEKTANDDDITINGVVYVKKDPPKENKPPKKPEPKKQSKSGNIWLRHESPYDVQREMWDSDPWTNNFFKEMSQNLIKAGFLKDKNRMKKNKK